MIERQFSGVDSGSDLLRALADELKLPLMQIARTAELTETNTEHQQELHIIETTASNALRLIDGYMLSTALSRQTQLDLVPLSVTATLYDVAQDLYKLSKLYDTTIDIKVKGGVGQVMANGPALRAGLDSLAYTLLSGGISGRKQTITLIAKHTKSGILAGVLGSHAFITADDLQSARVLYGRARQPAGGITQNSGVGLYIADNLFSAMETTLRVIKSGRDSGLAANLTLSRQLALL